MCDRILVRGSTVVAALAVTPVVVVVIAVLVAVVVHISSKYCTSRTKETGRPKKYLQQRHRSRSRPAVSMLQHLRLLHPK
jgi:hypothetical protein